MKKVQNLIAPTRKMIVSKIREQIIDEFKTFAILRDFQIRKRYDYYQILIPTGNIIWRVLKRIIPFVIHQDLQIADFVFYGRSEWKDFENPNREYYPIVLSISIYGHKFLNFFEDFQFQLEHQFLDVDFFFKIESNDPIKENLNKAGSLLISLNNSRGKRII